ncbi:MAG: DUF4870 domain-containing protein [Polyangiaceae bacterium]|jgi:uncharacterized membrane protein
MANPSQTPSEAAKTQARPQAQPAAPAVSAPAQVQVTVTQSPPANQDPKQASVPNAQAGYGQPSDSAQAPAKETPKPAAAPPKPQGPQVPFTERVPENVAAMLAYLFGWISGLVLLLVDRRPFVRYHAAQSVVVFATLSLLLLVLGGFFLGSFLPHFGAALLVLRRIVELVWLVALGVLMLKAGSGERYRVPYAASYADRAAGAK